MSGLSRRKFFGTGAAVIGAAAVVSEAKAATPAPAVPTPTPPDKAVIGAGLFKPAYMTVFDSQGNALCTMAIRMTNYPVEGLQLFPGESVTFEATVNIE